MPFSSKRKAGKYKLSTLTCGLAFCAFFLILAACLLISYVSQKESIEQQTLKLNEIHAKELSRIAQTLIYSMQSSLARTSKYIMANQDKATEDAGQQLLDYFRQSNSFFNAVLIVNEDGVVRMASPMNSYQRGVVPTTIQIETALHKREAYISKPYRDTNNRLVLMISYPLYTDQGNYRGMLAGILYLEEANRLSELFGEGSKKEDGSYFYVVDNEGNILYHPVAKRIGRHLTQNDNPIIGELQDGRSGNQLVLNLEHKEMLAGYAAIPGIRWGIIFQTPVYNTTIFSAQLIKSMLFYLVPVIILMLMIIYQLSLRLSRPLEELADYAHSIAGESKGSFRPEQNMWNYEAHELHYAIMTLEQQTREKERKLQQEAHYDALTGVLNRRALRAIMQNWIDNSYPFAIIMLDIDYFKKINDTYGHTMGDEMLRRVATLIEEQIQPADLCFRYGGEEFVILLFEADLMMTMKTAEQIRKVAEQSPTPYGEPVTVSLGMTLYDGDESSMEALLEQADSALYDAKKTGRNRMIVYEGLDAISAGD
ncbi:sensor domain-containing diguanylate cyclase [Paenibacillus hunanensis]|uniref:Diguanylate cyclase (GGDEF)-like protein n=1 Tax=Paenibacillus hunanensis TaxID=539262 RepID=A0ABU1J3T2_9BACL|nr:sensor domain-containing diguanylate cyclase [Paenibacillus hunanensis]MCL9660009.1 diguanylate cyclase [Paenibacillus hunanensis]MDR6246164.1 diguanylate cyclase (GGDEF)-like protein [Paenibacillus hunanensis]GGJ08605.1 sensor domain-containing diguanylate cyclase [Paenibacillus hunanensis]